MYRERGNLALARGAFEEAVVISEASGDLQGLVPALCGLATVLAAEEPDRARSLAERAVGCGTGMGYVGALLAAGWVAAVAGDREHAADLAERAGAAARARRDRPGMAEALALAGMVTATPAGRADRLREAVAVYREIGNPLGEAKVQLAMATLHSGPEAIADRVDAERRLEALGVRAGPAGSVAAGVLALLPARETVPLRVRSLGGFAVLRDGQAVPVSEWQSRRARDLLKLLVARRGRRVPRDQLMDALWPGEDPERLANRLSVALTTVRAVLDPGRRFAPEAFVVADKDAVALNLDAVEVDLERFLTSASGGLSRLRAGDEAGALPLLEAATAAYAGDFLEENPYDDWCLAAREEARSAFIAASRALAEVAASGPHADTAVPHLLRILAMDAYDEQAHVALVRALAAAGRHGEAHRRYLAYRQAMDELGVEPLAFPALRGGERRARPAALSTP